MGDEEKNRGHNVILIGFMGSGKTSVGIRLSYKLRLSVEDTDKMIESQQGCTISEIFAKDGEEAFRKMETELLRRISEREGRRIYSVGGGTPVRAENRELLRQCGTVFYLRAKPETVYERLRGDTTRPLLLCEDPLSKIREMIESRREAYESCADVIVDVDGLTLEEVMEKVLAGIKKGLGKKI